MTSQQQVWFTFAAVLIAGFSLIVSAISLGWNIYRDVVLKPRLRVGFALCKLLHPALKKPITTLNMSATNLGPGDVKCGVLMLKEDSWWRRLRGRTKYAALIHDYENPLSGQLPAKLAVGETLDLLIRFQADCFLSEQWTHIGLKDSFGRLHWVSPRDVSRARRDFMKGLSLGSVPIPVDQPADPNVTLGLQAPGFIIKKSKPTHR